MENDEEIVYLDGEALTQEQAIERHQLYVSRFSDGKILADLKKFAGFDDLEKGLDDSSLRYKSGACDVIKYIEAMSSVDK